MSFCPSNPNGVKENPAILPAKEKKKVRERLERGRPGRLTDHRRNPSPDETRTRIEGLARPTHHQNLRIFRGVRFLNDIAQI